MGDVLELETEPTEVVASPPPTQRYAGYLAEVTGSDDGMRLRLLIGPLARGVELSPYDLVVDPDEGSMAPEGELVECFDVLCEHPDGFGLDTDARRKWKVARVADEIISRLIGARVLEPVVADEPADDVVTRSPELAHPSATGGGRR